MHEYRGTPNISHPTICSPEAWYLLLSCFQLSVFIISTENWLVLHEAYGESTLLKSKTIIFTVAQLPSSLSFFFPVFWVSLPNFFPLIYISVTHLSLQSILSFSSRMPNSHFVALEMEAKKLVSASGMVKFHQDNYLSIPVNPHSGAGFEKASLANCKCWETEASCQEQNLLPYRTDWKRRREKKGLPLSAQVPFCLVPKACF